MQIMSFKIRNYKSFKLSEEVELSSGFNIIVGRNNVGKTALAEALGFQLDNKFHKSLETVPYRGAVPENGISQLLMQFELSPEEFINILKDKFIHTYIPIVSGIEENAQKDKFIKTLSNNILIKCAFHSADFAWAYIDGYGKQEKHSRVLHFIVRRSDELPQFQGVDNNDSNTILELTRALRSRVYFFRAERLTLSQSKIGNNEILSPNASNLPEVLNLLQSSNPSRFSKLNQFTQMIFPEITQITIPPIPGDSAFARILVWSIDPDSERDDLAMPLSESGTGIGQVLAILYVVLTSDYPRTIIIDEPQSFLHPGAIRKLFDILKQHPQHQYIITTHSPTVVTSADPEKLLLVRKAEAESTIEILDASENQKLRLFLSEIGARLSDVFAADDILWVEGDTEALCFPLILSRIIKRPLFGTAIVAVRQTGDLTGRHKKTIFEIYTRLSQGRGLLPPAIGFIFDREGRNDSEQADLIRQSQGAIHFLSRKMYENYLLNSHAIASVMSSLEGFRDTAVTPTEIEEWLRLNQWNTKYFQGKIAEGEKTNEQWIKKVDAAKILTDIFNKFSETRYEYNKLEHDVMLTKWLIENKPSDLAEVAELLGEILPS